MDTAASREPPKSFFRSLVQKCKCDSPEQSGSGWLILCAVMFLTVIRSGTTYSFGEIITDLIRTFPNHTMAEMNWIGTLSFTISMSFSPLSVRLIRSIKSRRNYAMVTVIGVALLSFGTLLSSVVTKLEWLFLTHSCLYGIGSSCIYMSESLIIGEYFDKTHKHHVLATSILLCGYPVASLIFNPLTSLMIERYGWRVSFRIMACLVLVVGMICQLTFVAPYRAEQQTPNADVEQQPASDGKLRVTIASKLHSCCEYFKRIFGNLEISLWLFGNTLVYIAFFMPFLNLPSYMESKGIARTKGSLALTLLSSAELISYILASSIGDRLKGSLIVINIIAATFLSFICFLWTFIDTDYYLINTLCVVLGAGLGLTIVYQFAASAEITGMPIDTAWPLTNLWSGIGVLFGPLFSGAIYDIRHHYHDVFYVMSGIYLIQLLIFGVIYYRRRRRRVWDAIVDYSELVEDHGSASGLRKASIDKCGGNILGEMSDGKRSSNGHNNPYRMDESNGLYKTTQFNAQNSPASDAFQSSLINADCYSYQNGNGLNPFRTTHHIVQPE